MSRVQKPQHQTPPSSAKSPAAAPPPAAPLAFGDGDEDFSGPPPAEQSVETPAAADETKPAADETPPPARARQSSAPFCPYHPAERCKSKGSDPFFTRYYCPVEGCNFSVKISRPRAPAQAEDEDFSAR